MDIMQAIEHARKVAEEKYTEGMLCHANPNDDELDGCIECAKEHEQLADWLEELQAYKSIGTIEEFREAREKQTPKKPNIILSKNDDGKLACCPVCESNVDWTYEGFWRHGKRKYCHECGQAIDWSE